MRNTRKVKNQKVLATFSPELVEAALRVGLSGMGFMPSFPKEDPAILRAYRIHENGQERIGAILLQPNPVNPVNPVKK